jgi:Zn-dependent protease with chaperone function
MYSAMNYSHPPLLERLEAIKSAMDKQKWFAFLRKL